MLLQFSNGEPFAKGATPYAYLPATERETSPRITISIIIDGLQTSAFVDTGGVYVICSPEIGRELSLDPGDGILTDNLKTGRGTYQGELYRINLILLAAEGESLSIDATAFIPHSSQDEWPIDLSCILGMQGCLERLRFAVDPSTDTFYFGDLI